MILLQIDLDRKKLEKICQDYKVKKLYFFGSITRDDFTNTSDLDVLVEFFLLLYMIKKTLRHFQCGKSHYINWGKLNCTGVLTNVSKHFFAVTFCSLPPGHAELGLLALQPP